MKERPIIFSGPMVRAILEGRKTMTRRVAKIKPSPYHEENNGILWTKNALGEWIRYDALYSCPYGKPGDRLWVRETVCLLCGGDPCYRADNEKCGLSGHIPKWTPAIHMPRHISRLTLEITAVRVERLQGITEDDAVAEGIEFTGCVSGVSNRKFYRNYETGGHVFAVSSFASLWDSINGKRPGCSWDDNPWVWVVEFKRV